MQQQTEAPPSWPALGIGGALAAMMFYFYRQDRKDSEKIQAADRAASEARMAGIISDFRSIIEQNTEAMTALERSITGHEVRKAPRA